MRYNTQRRLLTILGNILKQTIVPVLGLLFSWVITNKFSVDLWGQVATVSLWVGIVTHLSGWGNTQYLLKEFSAKPASLNILWQKCFTDRLPLIFITCCGILIYFHNTIGLAIAVWCLIEYVYQSYEPISTYYKKFIVSAWAEVIGTIVLFFFLFIFRARVNLLLVISLLMLADLFKTIVIVLYFSKNMVPFKVQKPDLGYYAGSLSFFLLGFIGLIEARADLIYVTTYLNHKEIAFYQIATTFFLFAKGGASMLILPFVPALYRINKNRVYKLSARFTSLGIVLSSGAFVAIYFILTMVYKFEARLMFMIMGFLSVIPAFYCYALITFLFKAHKQNRVLLYGLISILVNLLCSAFLVPAFGISGAIIAAAAAQWVLIPLYLYEMSLVTAG